MVLPTDMSDSGAIDELAKTVLDKYGGVDILVPPPPPPPPPSSLFPPPLPITPTYDALSPTLMICSVTQLRERVTFVTSI